LVPALIEARHWPVLTGPDAAGKCLLLHAKLCQGTDMSCQPALMLFAWHSIQAVQYIVLSKLFPCNITILGDINQSGLLPHTHFAKPFEREKSAVCESFCRGGDLGVKRLFGVDSRLKSKRCFF
jgi:hypothetical protein